MPGVPWQVRHCSKPDTLCAICEGTPELASVSEWLSAMATTAITISTKAHAQNLLKNKNPLVQAIITIPVLTQNRQLLRSHAREGYPVQLE